MISVASSGFAPSSPFLVIALRRTFSGMCFFIALFKTSAYESETTISFGQRVYETPLQ